MNANEKLLEALAKIAEIAGSIENDPEADSAEQAPPGEAPGCVIKSLPHRLLVKAAHSARMINPVNAPAVASFALAADSVQVAEPLRIALLTSKYWGPAPRQLTVSFMETTAPELKVKILSHMNAWSNCGAISFVSTNGVGDVRISRGPGGYWSYLGTDIQHIPKNRQTMNLEGFTITTPDSEYKRVVRHETGHTLGFPHEHMRKALVARIDPVKAYKWFWDTQRWDKATVDAQVLTPLDEATLMGTAPDETSIMCYQLPGSITKNGKPILGGTDINSTDCGFAGKIYPKAGPNAPQTVPQIAAADFGDDWAEADDVEVMV